MLCIIYHITTLVQRTAIQNIGMRTCCTAAHNLFYIMIEYIRLQFNRVCSRLDLNIHQNQKRCVFQLIGFASSNRNLVKQTWNSANGKYQRSAKLIPHICHRNKYVIHVIAVYCGSGCQIYQRPYSTLLATESF